jgi:hypothetical protein
VKIIPYAISFLLVVAPSLCAGETAGARLFCLSLRFQTAATKVFGETYTLDLSTDPSAAPNGELAPLFLTNNFSHGSSFRLYDPIFAQDLFGDIAFDVPMAEDANGNGFSDFFEVSQSVASTTQGAFRTDVDEGTVTATWSRGAGSNLGNCQLRLVGDEFGQLPEFNHTFELLDYGGLLNYAPGSNDVSGTIQLIQSPDSSNSFSGSIAFTKELTDRFNELILQAGSWTNQTGQTMSYTNWVFQRDLNAPTNYYGYVEFDDGDLSTAAPDFLTWILSIDDINDRNSNGIPDFSDDPVGLPLASRPVLLLTRSNDHLLVSISGEIGQDYELEEISSLSLTNWIKAVSMTLTNNPQVVELAIPNEAAKFWRVEVR